MRKPLALILAGALLTSVGLVVSQTVIERREFTSNGLPIGSGYGTALPTVANDGRPPVDGELFTLRSTGSDPRMMMFSEKDSDWYDVNTVETNVIREDFEMPGSLIHVEEDFTAAVVTDTGENLVIMPLSPLGSFHYRLEQALAGTFDPILNGALNFAWIDDANNDGVDFTFGGDRAGLGYTWNETVGTSMYCETDIDIVDISDTDSVYFGWIQVEAYQDGGAVEGHDTYALFHIDDNAGDLTIITETGGGGTLEDDAGVTWADGDNHVLRVVMAADSVSFFIDGDAVSQTNAVLNAANGGEFVCGGGFLNAAAGDPTITLDYVEIGIQGDGS